MKKYRLVNYKNNPQEYTIPEIARKFNVTEEQVKTHIRHRSYLRDYLILPVNPVRKGN